jgi:hypothetical protein
MSVLAVPSLASAASPTPNTYWVNNALPTVAGQGSSCDKPGYATIQSAVNAAPTHATGTILVCTGTYPEQLQVTGANTSLTIKPAQTLLGVVIQLPATPANSTTSCATAPGTGLHQADQNGFTVCGIKHTSVSVNGLIFDEAWSTGTCDDSLNGILVGGGSTLKLTHSEIDAAYPLNGCQGGIGIQDVAWTTPIEAGHLIASYDKISGYQKNGVTADGKGSTAQFYEDTVTGIGQTTQIAQNGIQVSNGALATITKTTIGGNECEVASVCGPNDLTQTQSAGVLFYGAAKGTLLTDSTIENNDMGLYDASSSPTLSPNAQIGATDNIFKNNRYEGIVFDQGRAKIAGNKITDGNVGIMFLQYAPSPPYPGQSYGDDDAITATIVKGQSVAAIQVLSDQSPTGAFPGYDTFTNCSISGAILDNAANYHLTFRS